MWQADAVKTELVKWDQTLSLPFTVYPKGHAGFKEKTCSVQLFARTGISLVWCYGMHMVLVCEILCF